MPVWQRLAVASFVFGLALVPSSGYSACSFNPFVPFFHALCPAEPGRAPPPVGMWVCNEAGRNVLVNAAMLTSRGWTTIGWHEVRNQNCSRLSAELSNTRIYLFAIDSDSREWAGSYPFCIGPTEFPEADRTEFCGARGGVVRNFFSVWIPDMVTGRMPRHYVHVIGPNRTGLNHPRADR